MGDNPERDPPFYFCKPADAVVDAVEGAKVPYPSATDNFHYEFEVRFESETMSHRVTLRWCAVSTTDVGE